jgi:hypothetical protein
MTNTTTPIRVAPNVDTEVTAVNVLAAVDRISCVADLGWVGTHAWGEVYDDKNRERCEAKLAEAEANARRHAEKCPEDALLLVEAAQVAAAATEGDER